jgi:hypothetical protein
LDNWAWLDGAGILSADPLHLSSDILRRSVSYFRSFTCHAFHFLLSIQFLTAQT